jgi:hypothetical protein
VAKRQTVRRLLRVVTPDFFNIITSRHFRQRCSEYPVLSGILVKLHSIEEIRELEDPAFMVENEIAAG